MLWGQDLWTDPALHMLQLCAEGNAIWEGSLLCLKLISITVKNLREVATSLNFKDVSPENDMHLWTFQLTFTTIVKSSSENFPGNKFFVDMWM